MATTTAVTVASGRQNGRQRAVFVKAIQKCNHDRQTATAKYVGAEEAVLRAEDKQSNENPKGGVP